MIVVRQVLLVNAINLPFDDGLFIAIAEGHILGNSSSPDSIFGFNPLVKGVIYPWIIYTSNLIYLNPIALVYLFYIIGCFIVTFKFIKEYIFKLIFFILMLASPIFFSLEGSRITREILYGSFLFLFVLIMRMLSTKITKYKVGLLSSLAGIILVIIQNIREERSWIWLIVIILFLFHLLELKKNNKYIIVISIGMLFFAYLTGTSVLKYFNYKIYGVYITNSTTDGEFPRLMKNLASIDPDFDHQTYVAIPKEKRMLAYKVSSELRKLQEYIEVDGQAWLKMGCDDVRICDDYTNGFFHVLLREAIVSNGYWDNQKIAQDYMRQVNSQLEEACFTKKIKCASGLPLANALGITEITSREIYNSFNFLLQYITNSIFDNSMIPDNLPAYQIMENRLWDRWATVIPSLPMNQGEFRDKYNHRITLFYPIYKYLYLFHQIIVIFGFISISLILLRKKYLKYIFQNKNLFFVFNTGNIFFLIWLTRGLIVSLNSATNFIGFTGRFAMPGQIFFSLAGILYLYILMSILMKRNGEINAR